MTDRLTIRRPDDWHVHLRDGEMLTAVAHYTARQFARAIVMPNLTPPVTSIAAATAYRDRVLAALPADSDFAPLMTCYLTDDADADEIVRGYGQGVFAACKLYPAHATTNSAHGVTDIAALGPVFDAMQTAGMPLLIHGEVTDRDIDIFDREAVFIDRTLTGLVRDFPALKVVLEHITTADAVDFVRDAGPNLAATITPQHLHLNRNALFDGGLRPHAYCLPVVKRERHRLAVRAAAVSGSAKFFLGTDSAPHAVGAKEMDCGCAGIFNAPFALESYLAVFEEEGAIDKFEGFASEHGARFYGLPLNEGTVTLERVATRVPERMGELVPFQAGETLAWRLAGVSDLTRYAGPCWRAVTVGCEATVLGGTTLAGRYNRPGERTLYMSGSPDGVAAAMARYGEADRVLVQLDVVADRLVDLRDAAGCAALGIDPTTVKQDWIAALDRGDEPPSWRASDRARAIGAAGLIDESRRAPGEWHLVLFRWNQASAPTVDAITEVAPARE